MVDIETKGTRLFLGLVVMILLAIIGFSLYQNFIGKGSIGQTVVFVFLALLAFGLVNVGIFARGKKLDVENFILIILMIGVPIIALLLLPKIGIQLFSTVGVSGAFSAEINLEGGVFDFIRKYIWVFVIGFGALILFRKQIKNWIKEQI